MARYAKSLVVGLSAAVLVGVVCWRLGLCPSVTHPPPPTWTSSVVAPPDAAASISVTLGSTTVTKVPWYVVGMEGLALVAGSGWSLRHSGRR
jgi:hypothetical protein